ncbi:MAG: AAA family ATPase [Candidatus Dormibacteria bacterium]
MGRIRSTPAQPSPSVSEPRARADVSSETGEPTPIDWPEFWKEETQSGEYVIDQIVPEHRQVAMYSEPKEGKSLLVLDVVAARANGRPYLGATESQEQIDVVYIDREMTADDLRERLTDLGYGPDSDLSRLHYYQLTSLKPLDTDAGGKQLLELVQRHAASLVVLDTMARVVEGDENVADTYRSFYKHTGWRLKAEGVALWRLDHAGKDASKGQRGSSAKVDDVDLVWRLETSKDRTEVTLTRTHSRLNWVPAKVVLRREEESELRHVLTPHQYVAGTHDCVKALDDLGVPLDATGTTALTELRRHDLGRRKQIVLDALRYRKTRE